MLGAPAVHEISVGMRLAKCRRCGCMADALQKAETAFGQSLDLEVRALVPTVERFKERMEPIAYDCLGCRKCWGANGTIKLAEEFEGVELDSCGSGAPPGVADLPVVRLADAKGLAWPPYPGDYALADPEGSVAVCTLSSRELPTQIVALGLPGIAIAGKCDTENIGVEKVVLNVIANPRIRWILLCGTEAQGHRTGDAFLSLKARGVDPNMRVLESASWRPILRNLTLVDVARFREQVELVDLVGSNDLGEIAAAAQECARQQVPVLDAYKEIVAPVERIQAKAPERLRLDPAGFFIVLPQQDSGLILLEHYENDGRLAHVVEGRKAAIIAATAVERGLVSRLDHAAYLGRELAEAEICLKAGSPYEQDAALGDLPSNSSPSGDRAPCPPSAACACK